MYPGYREDGFSIIVTVGDQYAILDSETGQTNTLPVAETGLPSDYTNYGTRTFYGMADGVELFMENSDSDTYTFKLFDLEGSLVESYELSGEQLQPRSHYTTADSTNHLQSEKTRLEAFASLGEQLGNGLTAFTPVYDEANYGCSSLEYAGEVEGSVMLPFHVGYQSEGETCSLKFDAFMSMDNSVALVIPSGGGESALVDLQAGTVVADFEGDFVATPILDYQIPTDTLIFLQDDQLVGYHPVSE